MKEDSFHIWIYVLGLPNVTTVASLGTSCNKNDSCSRNLQVIHQTARLLKDHRNIAIKLHGEASKNSDKYYK